MHECMSTAVQNTYGGVMEQCQGSYVGEHCPGGTYADKPVSGGGGGGGGGEEHA